MCRSSVEVEVVSVIKPTIISPGQALRIQARKKMVDHKGQNRVTGEEWLVSEVGIEPRPLLSSCQGTCC